MVTYPAYSYDPLTYMTVASINSCITLKYMEGAFFEIGVPATSLLFLFRVKAVYNNSKIITAFFGLLWLVITGLNVLILVGITGGVYIGYI